MVLKNLSSDDVANSKKGKIDFSIQNTFQFTSLTSLPPHLTSLKFFSQLLDLASLDSTYAQLNLAKSLSSSFSDLILSSASDESVVVSAATALYLELLFFENSLPLHKTLAAALAKATSFRTVIGGCFQRLCEDYGGGKGKRFCVSRVTLSVMPKLGFLVEVVEECAAVIALDAVSSFDSLVSETKAAARPLPIVMEQCQEAMSCLYHLFQRFSARFNNCGEALETSMEVIMSVLKSVAFSRDCYVAVGVSFCAACKFVVGVVVLQVELGEEL